MFIRIGIAVTEQHGPSISSAAKQTNRKYPPWSKEEPRKPIYTEESGDFRIHG